MTGNYRILHLFSVDVLTRYGERVELVAAFDADDAARRSEERYGLEPIGEPILIEEGVDIEEDYAA